MSHYLEAYAKHFTKDIDSIWTECDKNKCGILDKEETKKFLAEAKKCMSPERAANYDEASFDKLFNQFDEHKHCFIQKVDMAMFIKQVFKKSNAQLAKEKAMTNPANKEKLSHFLGDYTENFTKDIDAVWDECDKQKCGVLDKEETKKFLAEAKKCTKADRVGNYDEANFDKIFDEFDEHKNCFVEKVGMSILIKKAFAKSKEQQCIDRAASNKTNHLPLTELLGDFNNHITGDANALWKECAGDALILKKDQCKAFMQKLKAICKPECAQAFVEADFDSHFEKCDHNNCGILQKSEVAELIKCCLKPAEKNKEPA